MASKANWQHKIGHFFTYIVVAGVIGIVIWGLIQFNEQGEERVSLQNDVSETPEPTALQPTPTIELTQTVARKVFIFIDKNANGQKDANEDYCDICIAKSLVIADVGANERYPSADKLSTTSIQSGGVVNEEDLVGMNKAWAFFDDRKVLVPNTIITINDGVNDLLLPAIEVEASVIGSNASVSSIKEVSGAQTMTVRYIFVEPLPSFTKALNENQQIWVSFTPDTNDLGKSYLSSGWLRRDQDGSITGIRNSVYLEIDWHLAVRNERALEKDRVVFILP